MMPEHDGLEPAEQAAAPQRCTCGALPPADARFCHKCGRPLYDYQPAEQETTEEPEPATDPVVQPLPADIQPAAAQRPAADPAIGFRNRAAVRVALMVGAILTVLLNLQLPGALQFLWQIVLMVAGGFMSVHLYQRRTGFELSVGNGARMGWLTGVFCFLIMLILFTLSMAALAASDDLRQSLRTMMSARATPEVLEQLDALLADPTGLAAMVFGVLVVFFFMLSVLSTVGGALGARILQREH
jgi:hypothetical protein